MRGVGSLQKPKPRHIRRTAPRLACVRRAAFAPRVIRRFISLAVLAFAASLACGQELTTSSNTGYIDAATKESVLTGHARVTDGITLISADEIRYLETTATITATGHAVFTRGQVRLLADRFVFERKTQSFSAEHVRFGAHPYYAEAETAAGSAEEITLNRATVTYGEPGPWQPTFRADKVIYAPGQRLRTENAQAGIGHTQPLPFPRFQQNLKEPVASFASLTGGYRSSLGVFAELGLHLPVAADVRLGGELGIYTNRGVMFGPSANYGGGPDADLRGYFRSSYIKDHGDKKHDLLGRPVSENRAYAEWQHQQKISERLMLSAQLNWWKDSEIIRDFRPAAFFPVQEPDTFAEAVYAGDNYFLSAFARFQPNAFNRIQERLPELRFDLLPLAVGNGFSERFSASAVALREDSPLGGRRLSADRLDAYYALSRPFAPEDWLSFTPVAGARVTHYANIAGTARNGSYTRTLGEVGFDTALRTSATFDYKNARWKIDGLRHLFTPRLSYRYSPEAGRGRGRIPAIDRRTFATYLQPLGLGDQRNLDDLTATNTLRLGFDNTLQTRDPVYGSRDLFTLNVANDFRFKRAPGERNVSEIHTDLAFAPASWVSVDVYNSFTPQTLTLREFNSGITLRDGDAWSFRFANNFLRHQIQDYLLDGRVRLNETYEALARLHYDARRRRFNEQAYGLAQNLGNTWLVSYVVSLYSGPRRESHFGLNLQIEARGF